MIKKTILFVLLTLMIGTSCTKKFISDKSYLKEVEADFNAKKAALPHGNLFTVFDQSLTKNEKQALTFLYAYMPMGDITDYDGQFYLDNVRCSFLASEEMPWGDSIPEDIFRHFVMPIRVNNENLDESRMVFYEELKERVKHLSLYNAVLEVNHWCHEKVIYTPSDARTSSPLASVKSAFGRCGEESTFTVAALRSVGIPARQVYTPRWAHTDDNHAWVEAWVHGKWYFLGACEPEPVLNLGWFNDPAYRALLMHTKVFGKYRGPEEIMNVTDNYTEINVIDNYAPTAKSTVTVVDSNKQPMEGVSVEFKIYNYAEFYTVADKLTDAQGKASLTAGKGDMLVWASKDGLFGFKKVSFGKDEHITIVLDKKMESVETIALDIIPPIEGTIATEVTEKQKEANAQRLQAEDAIRNQYVSTFYTEEKAKALAQELSINPKKVAKAMLDSRGNWQEIETFLRETPLKYRPKALSLLKVVSAKDLRDTPADVLIDHLTYTKPMQSSLFTEYVLNPRVANELLTPYRKFFLTHVDLQIQAEAKASPQLLINWVKDSIQINDTLNSQRIPMLPMGVWKSRVADSHSRDIFFVALCRSLGIPARIESVTGKVQYARGLGWIDVDFGTSTSSVKRQGRVVAAYQPTQIVPDPKYYSHFTIAKILPSGKLQTLNFESGEMDMGRGDTWTALLKRPLILDEGRYLLVTGTRMANGSVLTELSFFTIEAGQTSRIRLHLRESKDDVQVIGNFNSENKFKRADNGKEVSLLATTGRGYYLVAILGANQEPTNHVMRDIASFKQELEGWGRDIVFLFPDEKGLESFNPKEFGELPNTITYGVDINKTIQKEITKNMRLSHTNSLPIFIIADTFNRVVFVSQGYSIGLGDQLMKVIRKL